MKDSISTDWKLLSHIYKNKKFKKVKWISMFCMKEPRKQFLSCEPAAVSQCYFNEKKIFCTIYYIFYTYTVTQIIFSKFKNFNKLTTNTPTDISPYLKP